MTEGFKVGDIVQLKSGGPKMTVIEASGGKFVRCTWFAGAKNESAAFPPDALILAPEDKPKK